MDKKTLLLNNNYEILGFVDYCRVIKMFFKNKVEVLSEWDDLLIWSSGRMKLPSIIRLKSFVRARPRTLKFTRYNIIKRDLYTCQYCGIVLTNSKYTIDHIIPKDKGGINSWENCVCCCRPCNSKKSNKTLEEAKMTLINQPFIPGKNILNDYKMVYPRHEDWEMYIGK